MSCRECGSPFPLSHYGDCRVATGLKPAVQPQDGTELYYAHMEADRNEAEDAYFNARPQLARTLAEQSIFRAGFERAYAKLWPLAIIKIDEGSEGKSESLYDAK